MSCHVNPLLPVEISIEPLISLTCKHHSEKKSIIPWDWCYFGQDFPSWHLGIFLALGHSPVFNT